MEIVMPTDMTVANEILRQLGGGMFLRITGAKNLLGSEYSLSMSLPQGSKGNKLKIKLEADDTYTVTLYRYRKFELKTLREETMVYCENLLDIFESITGLYATLHKRG
jgi:hypothetical protein